MKILLTSLSLSLFVVFMFFPSSVMAKKTTGSEDIGSDPNKQGLDTFPTATRTQDIEMILGSIYSRVDQASLSLGFEEIANRNGTQPSQGQGSDSNASSDK